MTQKMTREWAIDLIFRRYALPILQQIEREKRERGKRLIEEPLLSQRVNNL
jgi:hypothetical protein